MAVTLEQLRQEAFERAGDRQYEDTSGVTSGSASVAAVDRAINRVIRNLVSDIGLAELSAVETRLPFSFGYDYRTQVVTIIGTPTGGTFRLTLANAYADLAFDAASATVQTAIRAIDPFTSNGLTVSGSAGGPYTFAWPLVDGRHNVPLLVASATSLTGGTSPTIAVTATGQGSVESEIDMDDWFRDATGDPNMIAYGNLYIERTIDNSQYPCAVVRGGKYRKSYWYRPLFNVEFTTSSDLFVFRGNKLVAVNAASSERSYRATYASTVPKLVNSSDTLAGIGLRVLNNDAHVIAIMAAVQIAVNRNSSQYTLLRIESDGEHRKFLVRHAKSRRFSVGA